MDCKEDSPFMKRGTKRVSDLLQEVERRLDPKSSDRDSTKWPVNWKVKS